MFCKSYHFGCFLTHNNKTKFPVNFFVLNMILYLSLKKAFFAINIYQLDSLPTFAFELTKTTWQVIQLKDKVNWHVVMWTFLCMSNNNFNFFSNYSSGGWKQIVLWFQNCCIWVAFGSSNFSLYIYFLHEFI